MSDETAHNEHIGKMAAVTPQIIQCKLESYYPAGKHSVAATSPICHHVSRHVGTCLSKKTKKSLNKKYV